MSSAAAYAVFDGLFQQALIRHLAGQAGAARDLDENVQRVLDALTAPRLTGRACGMPALASLAEFRQAVADFQAEELEVAADAGRAGRGGAVGGGVRVPAARRGARGPGRTR